MPCIELRVPRGKGIGIGVRGVIENRVVRGLYRLT